METKDWPPFAVWQADRGFVCSDIGVVVDWSTKIILPMVDIMAEAFEAITVSFQQAAEWVAEFKEKWEEACVGQTSAG